MNLSDQSAFHHSLQALAAHDHLCLIYETRAEQFAAVVPFIRIGLERGERCFYIVDDNTAQAVLTALRAGGVDTDAALASGALVIAAKQDAYLKQGYFDPDWMIQFLAQATAEARAAGYAALRVTGEMTWMLGGDPGVERLIEYEAKLNFFFPEHDALAICQYNRRRFSPAIILDVIRTHPLVIYGGWVCRNPYYIPPDELLGSREDERAIARMLASLRAREQEQAALRASEERYRALAETAQDAIYVIDDEERLRYINPFAAALFDKRPADLIGQPLTELFPPEVVETQRAAVRRMLESGQPLAYEAERPFPTGKRWMSVRMTPLTTPQGEVDAVLGISRDITEHVRTKQALQQALQQAEHARDLLFSLSHAAQAVQSAHTPEEVYAAIQEQVARLGYRATIFEYDEATQSLRIAYMGYDASLTRQAEKLTGLSQQEYRFCPPPGSVFWRVLERGEIVHLADTTLVVADALPRPLARQASALVELLHMLPATLAPLRVGGRAFGILALEGADLSEADNPAVAAFANQAAIALENARLYEEAQQEIAERRRTEEELRKSKELFEKTFTSQRDAIFILDAQIPPTIVDCNPAAAEVFGYTHQEMQGRTTAFLHMNEATLREFQQKCYPAVEERGFLHLPEFAMKRKDGTVFLSEHSVVPLKDEHGRRIGWVSVVRDITERQRARARLEQQNQRLQVLREIDAAILAADSVEHIIGAALSRICDLVGCQQAFVALMDQATPTARVFAMRAGSASSCPQEMTMPVAAYQPLMPALSRNQPAVIDDLDASPDLTPSLRAFLGESLRSLCLLPLHAQNELVGVFGLGATTGGFFDDERIVIGREVANQVALAISHSNLINALRKLNAELEARVAERTAQLEVINQELEAFSYSVSHDLRAPLRVIEGFSRVLTQYYGDALGDDGRNYLARIRENVRRMGQLIDDLLALSRVTRREMQWKRVDLSQMARAIADELHAQEPGRSVDFEIEGEIEAWGDAGLLRIALHNLLDNAFKFTSTRVQARIRFGVAPSEGGGKAQTVFFVRDNGVGFDMAYADRLFGAFQRLHPADQFPGSGIGLATVQRIIHRHGGKIWCEAEVDKGATFYFTLGSRP